jgi:dGTPase
MSADDFSTARSQGWKRHSQSQENIANSKVDSIAAVRAQAKPLISLSEDVFAQHQELKRFLRTKLYNHPKVRDVMDEAGATLTGLFEAYMKDPTRLPPEHQTLFARAESAQGKSAAARVVADYVAGMTDRFAYLEYSKLKAAD